MSEWPRKRESGKEGRCATMLRSSAAPLAPRRVRGPWAPGLRGTAVCSPRERRQLARAPALRAEQQLPRAAASARQRRRNHRDARCALNTALFDPREVTPSLRCSPFGPFDLAADVAGSPRNRMRDPSPDQYAARVFRSSVESSSLMSRESSKNVPTYLSVPYEQILTFQHYYRDFRNPFQCIKNVSKMLLESEAVGARSGEGRVRSPWAAVHGLGRSLGGSGLWTRSGQG